MTAPWELDGILMLMFCGSDIGLFACQHIAFFFFSRVRVGNGSLDGT